MRARYLFNDGAPNATIHESRDAIFVNYSIARLNSGLGIGADAARRIYLLLGWRGGGEAGIAVAGGDAWGRGRCGDGGRVRGRAWRRPPCSILLEKLLTSGETFLEILVRSAAFARRRRRTGSTCDTSLWQTKLVGGTSAQCLKETRRGQRYLDTVGAGRTAIALNFAVLTQNTGEHTRVFVMLGRWRHGIHGE